MIKRMQKNSLGYDFNRLNDQQRHIVEKFNGPALVMAGPGTGKTRTVAVLIGKLLKSGLRMKEILALTFSDKAAGELRSRVLDYYPSSFDECWVSTFHSFCARILREQFFHAGVHPEFKLLTGFKEALLVSWFPNQLDPLTFPVFGRVLHKRGFQQELLTFIALLKSNLVTPEMFQKAVSAAGSFDPSSFQRLRELHRLYSHYEKQLKRCGYLDFRDLIALTVKVLQIPIAAKSYQEKFNAIIVDEFQDTDPAQFLLLTLLAKKSRKLKLAVIGDPLQSIYRFRGADPSMMSSAGPFKKKFKAAIFPLKRNYRSAKVILDIVSRLRWSDTAATEISELLPMSDKPGFCRVYEASDELEEARLVAAKIAELLIYGETRKYNADEIAILVRNNYQIDLIAESLRALAVPFRIAGDMKFFRSEEVTTVVAILKAVFSEGPERELLLKRAFASNLFKMDPLFVQGVFGRVAPGKTLEGHLSTISDADEAENDKGEDPENFSRAVFFAHAWQSLSAGSPSTEPLSVMVSKLLLAVSDVFAHPDSQQAANLLHFKNMTVDFGEIFSRQNGREATTADIMPVLEEWLTYYASTIEESNSRKASGVTIMTVHQSKGLEFPVVFIPGMCDGIFPVNTRESLLLPAAGLAELKKTLDSNSPDVPFFNPYPETMEQHLEEERRLLFVAMTRAEEGLIVTFPRRIGSEVALPAQFLAEIGLKVETRQQTAPISLVQIRTLLAALSGDEKDAIDPLIRQMTSELEEIDIKTRFQPREYGSFPPDEVVIPKDFVFSANSIKDFTDCPRRFYYQHILKIRNPIGANSVHLLYGQAVHACLEALHGSKPLFEGHSPTDDELEKIWNTYGEPFLLSATWLDRIDRRVKAVEALKNYCEAVFVLDQLPAGNAGEVEKWFDFNFKGNRCIGRFDRLVKVSAGNWIIDYKTSSSGASSQKMADQAFVLSTPSEIQLPFYLMAARHRDIGPTSAMTLYVCADRYRVNWGGFKKGFLKSASLNHGFGPEWGKSVSDDELDAFETFVEATINRIKNERVFDCEPSSAHEARSCMQSSSRMRCEYLSFCQEQLDRKKIGVPDECPE